MRRLHAWLAGAAGGIAGYGALRRRRRDAAPAPIQEPDPRADELRARLAEARAAGDDREEFEAGETPIDEAVPLDPAARRRQVHEEGRAALDQMQAE
ncbi:MAG: hypothetical protein V7644_2236 [Actinomycetota bacterium]